MLKLRSILPEERESLELHEYVPFVIVWPGSFGGCVYWRITSERHLLQIGLRDVDGAIASIEMPLFGDPSVADRDPWIGPQAEPGRPCFDVLDASSGQYRDDTRLTRFETRRGPDWVLVRFGTAGDAARRLRCGRCVFVLDADQQLIGFAVTSLEPHEITSIRSVLESRSN